MELPKYLVEMAEEVFETYLNRDPKAQELYTELKAAVAAYIAGAGIDVPVEHVVGELCDSVM